MKTLVPTGRRKPKQIELVEGPKAQENFENPVKNLFRAPKAGSKGFHFTLAASLTS